VLLAPKRCHAGRFGLGDGPERCGALPEGEGLRDWPKQVEEESQGPERRPELSWVRPATWPPNRRAAGHRKFDPAADVYALGAILYETADGARPPVPGGRTCWTTLEQVRSRGTGGRQKRLQPKLPRELEIHLP